MRWWRPAAERPLRRRELRGGPLDDDQLARAHHELVDRLGRAIAHLREVGDDDWARELEVDLRQVECGDAHGAGRFLGHLGGMGSLNDRLDPVPGLGRLCELAVAVVATMDHRRSHDRTRSTP